MLRVEVRIRQLRREFDGQTQAVNRWLRASSSAEKRRGEGVLKNLVKFEQAMFRAINFFLRRDLK